MSRKGKPLPICQCCKPEDVGMVEQLLARKGYIPRPCRKMRNAFVLNVNMAPGVWRGDQRVKVYTPIDWHAWESLDADAVNKWERDLIAAHEARSIAEYEARPIDG